VRNKEIRDSAASLEFRILNVSSKLADFPKGRLVQSPEFQVPKLGKVQFEFFPNGDIKSNDGWCSLRLRVPDRTRLKWSARVGRLEFGPRTDLFDQRQWWNKYGLLWLNFCEVSEVRDVISRETDSLICGVEVLEILPATEPVLPDTDSLRPSRPTSPAPDGASEATWVPSRPLSPSLSAVGARNWKLGGGRPQPLDSIASSPQILESAAAGTVECSPGSRPQSRGGRPSPSFRPPSAAARDTANDAAALASGLRHQGHLPPAVAAGGGPTRARSVPGIRNGGGGRHPK